VTSPELETLLAQFLGAFDVVFNHDWEYSKELLERDMEYAVGSGGTFVEPVEGWERKNWGARNALLNVHRLLLAEMERCGLAPTPPASDKYFKYSWPTSTGLD
jgi:hypothetical protein